MVRDKSVTTRVSPEAYKALLQKCANGGCSPYEYLRQLVQEDMGFTGEAPDQMEQTELKNQDEQRRDDGKIRIIG